MNRIFQCLILTFLIFFVGCKGNINPPVKSNALLNDTISLPLDRINLPKGFQINSYADDVPKARFMSLEDDGTLHVGTRADGCVYALSDTKGDFLIDQKYVLLKDGSLIISDDLADVIYRVTYNG